MKTYQEEERSQDCIAKRARLLWTYSPNQFALASLWGRTLFHKVLCTDESEKRSKPRNNLTIAFSAILI